MAQMEGYDQLNDEMEANPDGKNQDPEDENEMEDLLDAKYGIDNYYSPNLPDR
jgi:hypothetical protein